MNPKLLEDLKLATTDLARARRSLADAQFCQRHGMANALMFAAHTEHTTYQNWLRASEALHNAR